MQVHTCTDVDTTVTPMRRVRSALFVVGPSWSLEFLLRFTCRSLEALSLINPYGHSVTALVSFPVPSFPSFAILAMHFLNSRPSQNLANNLLTALYEPRNQDARRLTSLIADSVYFTFVLPWERTPTRYVPLRRRLIPVRFLLLPCRPPGRRGWPDPHATLIILRDRRNKMSYYKPSNFFFAPGIIIRKTCNHKSPSASAMLWITNGWLR